MDVNDREATTTWWVADVWEEPEGSPDTLVMTKFKT